MELAYCVIFKIITSLSYERMNILEWKQRAKEGLKDYTDKAAMIDDLLGLDITIDKTIETLNEVRFLNDPIFVLEYFIDKREDQKLLFELVEYLGKSKLLDLKTIGALSFYLPDSSSININWDIVESGQDFIELLSSVRPLSLLERRTQDQVIKSLDIEGKLYVLNELNFIISSNNKLFLVNDLENEPDIPNFVNIGKLIIDKKADRIASIVQFRKSLIQSIIEQCTTSIQYLRLFQLLEFESDIEDHDFGINHNLLKKWAYLEYIDQQHIWPLTTKEKIENKRKAPPNWSDVIALAGELNSTAIIENYLSSIDISLRNTWFLVLKTHWFIEGFDYLDPDLVKSDERLNSYIKGLKELGNTQLMSDIFDWPEINYVSFIKDYRASYYQNFTDYESELKKKGYIVGNNSGLSDTERRKILSNFYLRESEKPNPKRLEGMAKHLVINIKQKQNLPNYKKAVEHWEKDLNFLKSEYYDDVFVNTFSWPIGDD